MITKTNSLNMHPGGVPLVIHLSQYDSDFTLVFDLYSSVGTFTIESGTTATIRGTKSSGTGYSVDATLDVSNKRVTVTGDQQMTAAAGKQWFELTLTKSGKEINTANFILDVERAALDMDTMTDESVLKELEAIIQAAETATEAAEEAAESAESVSSYAETLAASIAQIITNTNDIAEIKTDIAQLIFTEDFKAALLACFEKVAWIDDSGQNLYDALEDAMDGRSLLSITATFNQGSHAILPTDSLNSLKEYLTVTAIYSDGTSEDVSAYSLSGTLVAGTSTILVTYLGRTALFTCTVTAPTLSSISCAYTQSGAVYTTDSLDSLKANLVVTATYSDSSTATIPSTDYTLSGTLTEGTSTITATYGGKTATFNVTVSSPVTLSSITATFTQGSAVIYDNASLDDLKQYLVVTAYYSDSTSRTVSDYTLSGTLTVGTSTITANYGGKTDTFSVTVTAAPAELVSITATFNQGSSVIYENDSLDSLKQYLTVTATYSDSSTSIVPSAGYALSGTLAQGTSIITATCGGKTDTFTVTVSASVASISASFNQDQSIIYNTAPLDDLKKFLAVTATLTDSSTITVPSTDYTLSGTLTVGTSTVTVSYEGKTTTFSVTVSAVQKRSDLPSTYQQVEYIRTTGAQYITTGIYSQLPFKADVQFSSGKTGGMVVGAGAPNSSPGTSRFFVMGYFVMNPSAGESYPIFTCRYGSTNWTYYTNHNPIPNAVYDLSSSVEYASGGSKVDSVFDYSSVHHTSQFNVPTLNYPIYLCCNPADMWKADKVALYKVKFYSGQTLLFDGIPCYRKSDNVSGLYDVVSSTFYPSEGTEDFVVGADVA